MDTDLLNVPLEENEISTTVEVSNTDLNNSIMLNNRLLLESNLYLFLILLTIVTTIAIYCFYKYLKSIFRLDIK